CKKQNAGFHKRESLIDSAQSWFESNNNAPTLSKNARFNASRSPDWGNASVTRIENVPVVSVPVRYPNGIYISSGFDTRGVYDLSNTTRLVIYRDARGNFESEQVLYLPDSNYSTGKNFSGLIVASDREGNPVNRYLVQQNGKIFQAQTVSRNNATTENVIITETCYEVWGYNYSVADPEGGVYWEEDPVCVYGLIDDVGSYGVAVKSGSSLSKLAPNVTSPFTVLVRPAINVVANVKDYFKCFTNVAGNGNTYTVTVCVDQPVPGTRQAWGLVTNAAANASSGVNPVDVGHSFLIFTQHSGAATVQRNIGFYPSSTVTPRSPAAPGTASNDDQHGYNVALTVTVTNSQFFSMLNYAEQNVADVYDLNTYNCTSFVLQSLFAGNVVLPATKGTWLGGSGYDPGDLGQDIQGMSLPANMKRSTVYNSHGNLGTCN
ncbi:MAG: hypothetical protein JST96_17595, partial [Bacteroidetes bacterium]|nr:hypothetical protein [Bacteroidota bacterium]